MREDASRQLDDLREAIALLAAKRDELVDGDHWPWLTVKRAEYYLILQQNSLYTKAFSDE